MHFSVQHAAAFHSAVRIKMTFSRCFEGDRSMVTTEGKKRVQRNWDIKTQGGLCMCGFELRSLVFACFEWQVSAATSSESKLGQCSWSSWVTSGAPLRCGAGSVNCYMFGGEGGWSGERGRWGLDTARSRPTLGLKSRVNTEVPVPLGLIQ